MDPNEAVVVQSFLKRIRFGTYKSGRYSSILWDIWNSHSHITFLECPKSCFKHTEITYKFSSFIISLHKK